MASAQKIVAVPTLADLLNDPERISALPKDVIAELRGQIAKLDTLLLSGLLVGNLQQNPPEDRLLGIGEAAQRLGMSQSHLYHHHARLPFTRHVGRKLLFSSAGIDKYIRTL